MNPPIGTRYLTHLGKIILFPGQTIPQAWQLADGQPDYLRGETNCYREIVLKPATQEMTIQEVVARATWCPVWIWRNNMRQYLTAIQLPMPARISDIPGISREPRQAHSYVLTLSACSLTLPIHEKIEVIL